MTKKKWVDGCTDFTDFHGIFTDFTVCYNSKSVKIP
jgi:hypothetical protein